MRQGLRKNLTKNKNGIIFILAVGIADFLFPIQATSRTEMLCISNGCPKVAFSYGDVMPKGVYERAKRFCGIKGCENKHYAKGLCRKHYNQSYELRRNKEKTVKRKKQYYQDNKERLLLARKQYRQEHKKELDERKKRWDKTPSGRTSQKIYRHNRRVLEKGLSAKRVQRVYTDNIKHYGTLTCILCGKQIATGEDSLEHKTPLSRGGTNDYDNLGISHINCNSKKYTMTLDEWYERFK